MNLKKNFEDLKFEALGVMFYDEERSYMQPLVYVKSTESLIWERGCGSGTAAVGAVHSYNSQKNIELIVNQPGGSLEVITQWCENSVDNIYIKGVVDIVAEGILYI